MYGDVSGIIRETTSAYTPDIVRRLNEAVFARVGKGVFYGYETAMTDYLRENSPVERIAGAVQAASAATHYKTVECMQCEWPLSQTRDIRFCMDIRLLQPE